MEKKEVKFGRYYPEFECVNCGGSGERKNEYYPGGLFSTGHWDYKKCQNCNGTGKNLFRCTTCGEMVTQKYVALVCLNQNCVKYNFLVMTADKVE